MEKLMKSLPLEWAFEAAIPDRDLVGRALRPRVIEWANKTYPILKGNLARDPRSGASSATEMLKLWVGEIPYWVFVAMIVNRDIGDDAVAMVAASDATATLMAESYLHVMQTRMGPSTEPV
jgi:hypothetical protein